MIIMPIWQHVLLLFLFSFGGAAIALVAKSIVEDDKDEKLGSKRD